MSRTVEPATEAQRALWKQQIDWYRSQSGAVTMGSDHVVGNPLGALEALNARIDADTAKIEAASRLGLEQITHWRARAETFEGDAKRLGESNIELSRRIAQLEAGGWQKRLAKAHVSEHGKDCCCPVADFCG